MQFDSTAELSGTSATGIPVPAEVIEALGDGRQRFPVVVTLGTYSYRTTVGPYRGRHMLPLSAQHRAGAGVQAGDALVVDLEPDDAPRTVEVPDDLRAAIDPHAAAVAYFDGLSYSHQKAYVTWIDSAKKADTRQRRIDQAVQMLLEGRTR